ncbi:MAG: hypothetical protein M1839_008020 [Geoglossum umbratile]|nr:MAG: hypothetical protein M1839_008020 [Geoglossum umbratile]
MTAVATPPLFQPVPRWNMSNGSQTHLNSMSADEVSRIFMPRKSAPRSNSSSSIASSSSTISQQPNGGTPNSYSGDLWSTKKKAGRGLWPSSKAEAMLGVSTARPHSIASSPAGPSAASAMSAVHQPTSILPSQHMLQPQAQQNGVRSVAGQGQADSSAVLYLLPMNGTFERKTISVPFFPDVLRIGRQTNAKTLPTSLNGYFDSKVLSRQHAEIWADRNGKIWIRDVKSSNGTFVNGQRLSAENRDSEPHELREGDILELGIDIVSEDQKTVVHHKVAARVELAGFYGNGSSAIDLNFGDIDPGSGGSLMNPPLSHSMAQMRGRAGSQGSINGTPRMGSGPPSVAGNNTSVMGQQRHLNFWLTPVTMEQIVKKLTTELKAAKQQSVDLQRTGEFIDALLAQKPMVDRNENSQHEPPGDNLPNGIPVKVDTNSRFSDPPAPPPQQPLPEKPDFPRTDSYSSGSFKRSDAEKIKPTLASPPLGSKPEPPQQYHSLVEALASAKRELDSKSARVMDLENMLQKERLARESAEERALRLERATANSGAQSTARESVDSVVELVFEPPAESNERWPNGVVTELEEFGTNIGEVEKQKEEDSDASAEAADAAAAEASAARLHQGLEKMVAEMDEMKQLMEKYRRRVEVAEEESASSRKSLAEMVEKIRREESERKAKLEVRAARSETATQTDDNLPEGLDSLTPSPSEKPDRGEVTNGKAVRPVETTGFENAVPTTLTRTRRPQDHLYQSGPYASILGVVVLGVGLMAFLNGWQKTER